MTKLIKKARCNRLGLAEGLAFNQLTITQNSDNTLIKSGNEILASLTGVNVNLIGAEDFTAV